jgi:hypothetical protein
LGTNNRLQPSYNHRYPKRVRGRHGKATAEAAINSIRRNTEELFEQQPICAAVNGAGAATGATGDVDVMNTGKNLFEYHIKGTQTIVAPAFNSSGLGLNIAMDQTNNDGVELTQGITSRAKHAFTVGTDQPFFLEVQFSLADVSGTDDCAIGFRKAEAYQANVDDYNDAAFLNVISGDIKIETILANAATVTTDTTQDWADAATHTLRVEVSGTGVVSFKIDGAAPSVTAAYSFASGTVVVPFMYFLQDSDICDTVLLKSWKCGLI